jgi:hypothetical protein
MRRWSGAIVVRFLSAFAAATHRRLLMTLDCDGGEPKFRELEQVDTWLRLIEGLRRVA